MVIINALKLMYNDEIAIFAIFFVIIVILSQFIILLSFLSKNRKTIKSKHNFTIFVIKSYHYHVKSFFSRFFRKLFAIFKIGHF